MFLFYSMLIFKIYSIHFKRRIYADHILNIITEYSVNKLESEWGWSSHVTLRYLQLVLQRLSSAQLSLCLAGFGNQQLRSWAEPFDLTRACTKIKVNSPPHLQSLLLTNQVLICNDKFIYALLYLTFLTFQSFTHYHTNTRQTPLPNKINFNREEHYYVVASHHEHQ